MAKSISKELHRECRLICNLSPRHKTNMLGLGSGQKSLPGKLRLFVYLSHTLSSWGDRMWSFGVGLFMMIISPESLRVTAVYGLCNNVAILLLGAVVGDWVDKTPRLKAARSTLIIQNSSVLVCSLMLYFVVQYKEEIRARDGALALCYVAIITVAVVSNLASMGTQLAIQRDWVIEICGRDNNILASVTAVMRRIDLTTKLVAPIATGQIMYFASPGIGALFIAGWNLVSVFIEYVLLWKVYILVPALRSKKKGYKAETVQADSMELGIEVEMDDYKAKPQTDQKLEQALLRDAHDMEKATAQGSHDTQTSAFKDINIADDLEINDIHATEETLLKDTNVADESELRDTPEAKKAFLKDTHVADVIELNETYHTEKPLLKDTKSTENNGQKDTPNTGEPLVDDIAEIEAAVIAEGDASDKDNTGGCSCCGRMFSVVLTLVRGWKIYMKYDVAWAGMGLAALYMTVLGFDNITVGYAYSQGVNESINGALMAGGAITGILGTIIYPVLHRRMGLERTGLFGFFFEICFLCLCVASIWTPGSPFDPTFSGKNNPVPVHCSIVNTTGSHVTLNGLQTTTDAVLAVNGSDSVPVYKTSLVNHSAGNLSLLSTTDLPGCEAQRSYISVSLLMAGIIGARCGLWMADLTITQLFLENVRENERGIVSGTQNALNQLMNMLKFLMVVVAPQPEVFGILILISFLFICLGWMSYAKFSHHARGHLFHFEKCVCSPSDVRNNNAPLPVEAS